ncbi:NUDIX domain-containing protein [Clostridium tertium]|jgi:NAD+ diphosphatase|uniref:NAD(+) diphosphatase n=1 Tax=Clostridium TaxID=1485 RepID=UPI00115813ED|nr:MULTISPECIES: NUDIX domain-containing protein [Clostridium]MBP1869387.1 NAD+ diphosphatase [Clostridium tertium]MBS5308046.1 NUDIX domain-containing protein [Clostridium sp.]MBS5886622.1 NUDIX domain-containing protein [Clostridium sp.]MDB1922860.1 NUDIX domain-containing protein [Clostridium tertium]MDB1925858.1 NUDIX domain-containing protein [Clostridium tertium]
MKYKFCPLCGRGLEEKYSWDEGGVPYCSHDDVMFFDTPKPCIMVAIIKDDEILLLKQSYIYKNSKVLLTGYVDNNETAEEAVYREVKEEAGIDINNITYVGSDYVKDKEILMITFMADFVSGKINKSDEVEGMGWSKLADALDEMKEDIIGTKVVKRVLEIRKSKGI